jgi:hypothetical protein
MVYDDDTGRRNHYELDSDYGYPEESGRVRLPSAQIQLRIIELAEEFGWRSANRIRAELSDEADVSVETVRYVLNQSRSRRTRGSY